MKMRVNLGVSEVLVKSSECQLVAHEVSRHQWWLEENTNIMSCKKLFISHVTLLLMMKRVSLPMACSRLCSLRTLPSLRRHREEGDDPEADPPRHRLNVHPEGDPRHEHRQDGGQVALWVECKNAVRVVSGGTWRDQYFRY